MKKEPVALDFKKYHLRVKAEDLNMFGAEREWAPGSINKENRATQMMLGLNWLNYVADAKDQRKFMEDWIRATRPATAKQDLALWNKASDRFIRTTQCNVARLALRGFELTDTEKQNVWESVVIAAQRTKEANLPEEGEASEPRIGIQERMDNQALVVVDEVEAYVSRLLRAELKPADITSPLGTSKLSAVHYKKLAKFLEPVLAEYAEIRDARAGKKTKDTQVDQLVEAYKWVSNKALKGVLEYLDVAYGTANRLALEKKVSKTRKKKPIDKARQVKNFKFLHTVEGMKLTSLNPVATLNSSEVWVYNARTRKLGVYRSEFPGSIMVKGSSFIGFAVNTSVQKKLRKPEKQIAEFQAMNKSQIKKWFDAIKGVEHRLNGRSNPHQVLVRATP